MDKKHFLEWNSNPAFRWEDCKKVVLTKGQLTHEGLHEACGDYYEIQRVLVEMVDGYNLSIQSATKNKVNITLRYVTIAGSTKRRSFGVFQYDSYTCRREFVKKIVIWVAYPPQVRINRRPDPSDKNQQKH